MMADVAFGGGLVGLRLVDPGDPDRDGPAVERDEQPRHEEPCEAPPLALGYLPRAERRRNDRVTSNSGIWNSMGFSCVQRSAAVPVSRCAASRTAAPARHGQLPGPVDATRRPVRHARGVIQTPECIPRRQRFASASSLA